MAEFRMPSFRRPRAPSLRTFARVMLGTRILGFLFAVLWATDGFVWWKLLVVVFTLGMVVLQVRRVRSLEARGVRTPQKPGRIV